MFRVNIENLVRNKLYICKDYHIQPSEIDRMMFFDYEHILEEINVIQKEQQKQQEEEEKAYGNLSPNSISRSMSNSMNNQMQSFKMPKVEMPKF